MTDTSTPAIMPIEPTSPGALIKSAREKAGLHLAILSVNLKVSVKQLEALEADRFDQLQEPVFARALAAKVCRMVKLDPALVLALMPAAPNGLKPLNIIDTDQSAPFANPRLGSSLLVRLSSVKLWLTIAVLIFLTMGFTNDWFVSVFPFQASPEIVETAPVMPPAQEAGESAATDAQPAELPKAMVFEGSSTGASVPNQANPVNLMSETKK